MEYTWRRLLYELIWYNFINCSRGLKQSRPQYAKFRSQEDDVTILQDFELIHRLAGYSGPIQYLGLIETTCTSVIISQKYNNNSDQCFMENFSRVTL